MNEEKNVAYKLRLTLVKTGPLGEVVITSHENMQEVIDNLHKSSMKVFCFTVISTIDKGGES